MMRRPLFWLLLLLSLSVAHAAEIRLDGTEERLALDEAVEAYEDRSARLDIDSAARERSFVANPLLLRQGHTSSAIWLRLTIGNDTTRPLTRWLELRPGRLGEATLFRRHKQQWQSMEAGMRHPFRLHPIEASNAVFPIQLEPHETATIYLRVASPMPITIEPVLWDPLVFRTVEGRTRLIDGMLLGGLVVTAAVGLLLALVFRERAFIFNALATVTFFLGELSSKGYSLMFLWPDVGDWLVRGMPVYAISGVCLNLLFLRDLLATRSHFPRVNRLLWGLIIIELIPLPGILLGYQAVWAKLSFPLHAPITLVMMLVGIYAISKGVRAARYYTAGYAVLALGSLTHGMALSGANIPPTIANLALPLGMLLTNMFLLASVVDRILTVRREKEAAKNALIELHSAHEAQLEKAVTERTADLNAALVEARKSKESQTRLLAYISHDLRAPLATIINYVQLLGDEDEAKVRRHKATIERSARHQLELIDDLVEYARGELDQLELIPAPTYLHDWLDNIARQAELLASQHGNRFLLDADKRLPAVAVFDPKRLRQVVLNLLGNAAKFTSNGDIRLKLHGRPQPDGKLELSFAVADTGSGIPQDDIERIFLPFERRKSAREGYGLGLSIARQLVRAMGGELEVTSVPGKGSRFAFRVMVEIADEAEVAQPVQAFVFPEPFGAGKTLLVADDDVATRSYLQEVLYTAEFDIVSAANGSEALQLALEREFDAIIVDQAMPGLGGWDVLRGIHEAHPARVPPMVLCSAMHPQRPADFPPHVDFDKTLLKPVDADELLQVVRDLLDGGAPVEEMPSLPDDLLAPLRLMIANGSISEIEIWADHLAAEHPEHTASAARIKEAALRIDFAELSALAKSR